MIKKSSVLRCFSLMVISSFVLGGAYIVGAEAIEHAPQTLGVSLFGLSGQAKAGEKSPAASAALPAPNQMRFDATLCVDWFETERTERSGGRHPVSIDDVGKLRAEVISAKQVVLSWHGQCPAGSFHLVAAQANVWLVDEGPLPGALP